MTKILVCGAGGMLGHQVMRELSLTAKVVGIARRKVSELGELEVVIGDLRDTNFVEATLDRLKPEVIVNCAGVIKQRIGEGTHFATCQLNTLLPHALGIWCQDKGARLIHVSSDCVFAGDRSGPAYRETDRPDAVDLYGYSKAAGEVTHLPHALTLRTSIVGRETAGSKFGLLEWFLSQPEGSAVRGFRNHMWSGVTTRELSKLISRVIHQEPTLAGLFQIASKPINKYDLLRLFAQSFKKNVSITEVDGPEAVYRVLDGTKLELAIGYTAPSLERQVNDLC